MNLFQLFDMPQMKVNHFESRQNGLIIFASSKTKGAPCPECGMLNYSVHDYYYRSVTDLPIFQKSTNIQMKTRKFRCKNSSCNRKVFSEQNSHVVRYSRRTDRVSKLLNRLSIELTGKQGSQLTALLLMSVSASTLTRIALRQPLPEIKQPRVLGVDDWAYRKGVSYGTILIDMETSRPIDILPSREKKELENWLTKYPDVEIVTRDRASSYSSAINEVCPNSIQIADRFHLLMNLSDALDRYFKSISQIIKKTITEKTNEILNDRINNDKIIGTKTPEILIVNDPQQINDVSFNQRLCIFKKVKELQSQGFSARKISRDLGISRSTVGSYFLQDALSPKKNSKSTNIELFTSHILARLNEDGYQVKNIIDEITQLGYSGSQSQAYENINKLKEQNGINTPDFAQIQRIRIPFVKPLHSRKLAKYIDRCTDHIEDQDERTYMATLLDGIPEVRIVQKLVQIFKTMLNRGCGNIRRWIDFIKESKYKLSGLRNFANGLMRDIEAVENGINMHWSNGGVEGHVNRVKSKKRQMYGRAGFELLKRKVILSQTG